MFFRNGQAEQYRRALGEREEGIGKVYLPPSAARKKHLKISQCFLGSASLVSCPMPPWQLFATLTPVQLQFLLPWAMNSNVGVIIYDLRGTKTRRRMARERRGAISFNVNIKTIYYKTLY